MLSFKRLSDAGLSLLLIILFSPVLVVVTLLVKMTSEGPVFHCSKRVGKNNRLFLMPKFRTMRMETPQIASHLLSEPTAYMTPVGNFLRQTKLDELPQLFSILTGNMTFVGPRPALYNQLDLIALRTERCIHALVPGLTGWAQVNAPDDMPISAKVQLDFEYLKRRSLKFDLLIIGATIVKVLKCGGMRH